MLDTDKTTSVRKVTTKDLQTSIYQNLCHKYSKKIYEYLIEHNDSPYIVIDLESNDYMPSVVEGQNDIGFTIKNPKFTKGTSELELQQYLQSVTYSLTFSKIIDLLVNKGTDDFVAQILDDTISYNWVVCHLDNLLLIANCKNDTGLQRIFNDFTGKQNYALVQNLIVNIDNVLKIINQNWYCINLLLIIISNASSYKCNSYILFLAQKLIDKMADYGCIRNEGYSFNLNYNCFEEMLSSIHNLHFHLPLVFIQTLFEKSINIDNSFTFTAKSKRDVIQFLAIVDQADLDSIKLNLLDLHYCRIDFNGYESVVDDYKSGLKKAIKIMPENQKRLDKLNMVLEKGIIL